MINDMPWILIVPFPSTLNGLLDAFHVNGHGVSIVFAFRFSFLFQF